jgi:hypothetical protein
LLALIVRPHKPFLFAKGMIRTDLFNFLPGNAVHVTEGGCSAGYKAMAIANPVDQNRSTQKANGGGDSVIGVMRDGPTHFGNAHNLLPIWK